MGGICNNQQVPRNPRAGVKDMLLSLAIILVPVMLIVWFFTRTPDEPNIPVSYTHLTLPTILLV